MRELARLSFSNVEAFFSLLAALVGFIVLAESPFLAALATSCFLRFGGFLEVQINASPALGISGLGE